MGGWWPGADPRLTFIRGNAVLHAGGVNGDLRWLLTLGQHGHAVTAVRPSLYVHDVHHDNEYVP
jgi:hypothetical protein